MTPPPERDWKYMKKFKEYLLTSDHLQHLSEETQKRLKALKEL